MMHELVRSRAAAKGAPVRRVQPRGPRFLSVFRRKHPRHGFTLIEVIVALGILGIATTIIVSLFMHSMRFGKASHDLRVATELAEGQLLVIEANPGVMAWPSLGTAPVGQPLRLALQKDECKQAHVFRAPETTAAYKAVAQREVDFYERFSWDAYAKLSERDASSIELTVVVRWTEEQKPKEVTLTSYLPRTHVEGAA